jgi:hypothetical protein
MGATGNLYSKKYGLIAPPVITVIAENGFYVQGAINAWRYLPQAVLNSFVGIVTSYLMAHRMKTGLTA